MSKLIASMQGWLKRNPGARPGLREGIQAQLNSLIQEQKARDAKLSQLKGMSRGKLRMYVKKHPGDKLAFYYRINKIYGK